MVKRIRKGIYFGSEPQFITVFNNQLFFTAIDTSSNRELWVSDGTEAGTQMFLDIYPGITGSNPAELTVAGGKMYFAATHPVHGRELWVTDGTAAGTTVFDINPGAGNSSPHNLFNAGNALYFFAYADSALGYELYKIDLPPNSDQSTAPKQLSVKVFPNPASKVLQVELSNAPAGKGISRISVTDVQGREVLSLNYPDGSGSCVINTDSIDNGIYILRVATHEHEQIYHRLVIMN